MDAKPCKAPKAPTLTTLPRPRATNLGRVALSMLRSVVTLMSNRAFQWASVISKTFETYAGAVGEPCRHVDQDRPRPLRFALLGHRRPQNACGTGDNRCFARQVHKPAP